MSEYQPKTGTKCHCKKGVYRDNCPNCEGTGWVIDFAAIRQRTKKPPAVPAPPRIVATTVSTEHAQPEISATFDDGTTRRLFGYLPEAFRGITPAHFQGLTEAEAHSFKSRTDAAYLQGGVS